MSFTVAAEAYDRFMGRYSTLLAPLLADLAGVTSRQRVLDVGAGPGALTTELVSRVGADQVVAVEPEASFVEAVRARNPGVAVERAAAEHLPFPDRTFDVTLAQLVVHFLADPVAGLREMARVTRPGGAVAACVWDFGGDRSPLSPLWVAARELEPGVADESERAGAREGQLGQIFAAAGLRRVEQATLPITVEHPSFEDWWEPFRLGVGPSGAYVAGLGRARRDRLRERIRSTAPAGPFPITAVAWAARGSV